MTMHDYAMARARVALLLWIALLLVLGSFGVRAQETDKPLILVAVPKLSGFYERTVLVAVPIAGDRHVGFIINRPTPVSMGRLFPQHDPSRKVADPVYLGGPEMVTSIFAMLESADNPGQGNFTVMPGIQVVAEAKSIDRIIEQAPNSARYYAGFVAWRRGELQQELDRGFWFTMSAEREFMFRKDAGDLWEELLERSSRVRTKLQNSVPTSAEGGMT